MGRYQKFDYEFVVHNLGNFFFPLIPKKAMIDCFGISMLKIKIDKILLQDPVVQFT